MSLLHKQEPISTQHFLSNILWLSFRWYLMTLRWIHQYKYKYCTGRYHMWCSNSWVQYSSLWLSCCKSTVEYHVHVSCIIHLFLDSIFRSGTPWNVDVILTFLVPFCIWLVSILYFTEQQFFLHMCSIAVYWWLSSKYQACFLLCKFLLPYSPEPVVLSVKTKLYWQCCLSIMNTWQFQLPTILYNRDSLCSYKQPLLLTF
jgi:hypothetical protein